MFVKINYFSSNSLFQIITEILHSSKDSNWCWLAAAVKINLRTLSDWSFRLDKPRENNKKRIRIYDREKLTTNETCEICYGNSFLNNDGLGFDILGLDCSKMSAWRAAGLSYVRYSFVASNALKKAMTTEAQGKLNTSSTITSKSICPAQNRSFDTYFCENSIFLNSHFSL